MSRFLHLEGLGGGQLPPTPTPAAPSGPTIATVLGTSIRLAFTVDGLAAPVAQIAAAFDALDHRLSVLHV